MNKKLTTLLALLVLFGGYALFMPAGSVGQESFNSISTTDAAIRERLESGFTNGSKTFQALKQYFPTEYEKLIASSVEDIRNNVDSATVTLVGAEFIAKLRIENAVNFQMVGVGRMREYMQASIPILLHLKAEYGAQACNALSIGGGLALLKALGPRQYAKDKILIALFDEKTANYFRSAAEGKSLQFKHDQPTENDWSDFLQIMFDKGFSQEDFDMLAEGEKYPNDPRLCNASINWLRLLTELDSDSGKRIIPFVAIEMAKS